MWLLAPGRVSAHNVKSLQATHVSSCRQVSHSRHTKRGTSLVMEPPDAFAIWIVPLTTCHGGR